MFHSPKRGVMSATHFYDNLCCFAFHSPKRGVMSATAMVYIIVPAVPFHSPKRGVMSATCIHCNTHSAFRFIPLNGASCLQLKGLTPHPKKGFIPLNGASCLQHLISKFFPEKSFHSPKRGVMSATFYFIIYSISCRFIPLNGASCLQRLS